MNYLSKIEFKGLRLLKDYNSRAYQRALKLADKGECDKSFVMLAATHRAFDLFEWQALSQYRLLNRCLFLEIRDEMMMMMMKRRRR